MKNFKILTLTLAFVFGLILTSCSTKKEITVLSAPAGKLFTHIDKNGKTVIPNGRFITPLGKTITVAPHPYGLTLSRDGKIAVTANSGTRPLSITIIKNINSQNPTVLQIPPGAKTNKGVIESVFMGLAVSPDDKYVYASAGQKNGIYIFAVEDGKKVGFISCYVPGGKYDSTGYIGDLTLSRDGSKIFAVDQINFRVVIIDVNKRKVIKSVDVGRYPFGIALSKDEKRVYVANVGMYRYSRIKKKNGKPGLGEGLSFPPFAYLSKEAEKGVTIDSFEVPGLGKPNVPESFSVWAIDVSNLKNPEVTAKIKTGILVGEKIEGIPAIGGSSPNSLACTEKYVFVSNGNDDNITVIDAHTNRKVKEIYLKPAEAVKHFRGVIPFGLDVSPDGKRLYVCESGINAVAVIDIPSLKVLGHIPTGWFPAKVKVSPDGRTLVVANAKGFGSGPNGGKNFKVGPEGTYIGNLMKGTVEILGVPKDEELKKLTEEVVSNNFKIEKLTPKLIKERGNNPIPIYGGERVSPIKHIVFISKENRTFDEIFGQVKKANGAPELARYGKNVTFSNRDKTRTVKNATVMPNHLELANEFAIADNFYVDSDVSADGHRWLANTYPNEWVETCTPASYGRNRRFDWKSKAPGALAMNGAAGAVYPEDYNQAGTLWDHLDRNGIRFRNFGFGVMFSPAFYKKQFKYQGIHHFANYPLPAPLFKNTSRTYPTFNLGIPDQFRIDQFIKEFKQRWLNAKKTMPPMITVIIPNDHGAGERPKDGYPFRESYMADNDLAVGRIIEFLSHTKYWKSMLILITEDDAQSGVDHVDAHRSVLMVVSPYVKRDYVGHVHYSFGSIFKTFFNVLGLPYLNQYDAGATDLSDMFTGKPNFKPYNALPVDKRIFDPHKALDPFDENFDWKAVKNSPEMDDVKEMMKESESDRLEGRVKK